MSTRNFQIHTDRIQAVRRRFDEWRVKGILIGSGPNRRWLSGFTGSAGQLLITREKALLATDSRYWEQVTAQAPAFTLFKHQRRDKDTADLLDIAGVTRIGLEAKYTTLAEAKKLEKFAEIDWIPLSETVEPTRAVKTAAEIKTMRRAAAITDRVMQQVNDLARPGMSERTLAWELEKRMREAGAESMAFPVIVASGPNAALPHHQTGERTLQIGDPIIIDMGAVVDGYHSDMTRSFHLGDEPDDKFWHVYNLVLKAQTAALTQIAPGQTGKEADALAREVIEAAGHGEHFGHGLGHGVGLYIHEDPHLSSRAEESTIATGMVTTIEPGVYLPGWGGVRIEDLVQLTDGGVAYLSHCPKNPIISIS